MCGRFGSTLTVCASPMWLVSAISTGASTSVMSISSSPPRGAASRPATPWSWQRPAASEVSIKSWASSLDGVRVLRVERDAGALRRRLDVVLEPGRSRRVGEAARGRMARHEARRDLAAVGELHDRLPAGVRADPERADRRVRLAVLREEVEVRVRVAGRDGADEIPRRVRSARLDAGDGGDGGENAGVRMVERQAVPGQRRSTARARPPHTAAATTTSLIPDSPSPAF